MLNEPVFTELEVEVLELVECESVVVTTIEVPHFCLFLSDLCSRACARISICRLQAELRRVHVVLLAAFDWSCGESSSPPEECKQDDVPSVMDVEDVLSCHKMLCPEELPERCATVVRNLEC